MKVQFRDPTEKDWKPSMLLEDVLNVMEYLGWRQESLPSRGPFLVLHNELWDMHLDSDWWIGDAFDPSKVTKNVRQRLREVQAVVDVRRALFTEPQTVPVMMIVEADKKD